MDAKQQIFSELCQQIKTCQNCSLHLHRQNPVPGEGNLDARLFFIGEGPGATEDQQGRPFVGQAGKILDQLLADIGIDRKDVFIGNAVKCRPPGNRTPTMEEINACEPFLLSQIALIEPQLIVLLGSAALNAVIGPGHSISLVRGSLMEHQGMLFFPVFHPAASLYRREIFEQLKKDFKELQKIMKEKLHD